MYDYGSTSSYGSNVGSSTDLGAAFGAAAGAIAGVMIVFVILIIALVVLGIVANWKLFKKMGYEGWKSLIFGATQYLILEKIGISQKWLILISFGSAIMLVPFIGWLAYFIGLIYFAVLYSISLARSFGKSDGFGIGLLLLGPIFQLILAFGDAEYIGATPMNDIIFGQKNNNSTTPSQPQPASSVVENVPNEVSNESNESSENVEDNSTEDTSDSKFCPNCGTKTNADAEECSNCGTKF